MPDTIQGELFGKPVTMRVGDKVGLLSTDADLDNWDDTFLGTDVEIEVIHDSERMTVRTHNGFEMLVHRLSVVPALPKKRGGRKPVERGDGEQIVRTSITLPESDIAYLLRINPKNVSDAIRQLIRESRDNEML